MTPRLRRWFKQHIAPLLLVVLLVTSFRSAIADWNIVPSGSMNPTIVEGDRIFVNKLAFGLRVPFTSMELAHWAEPQRGDVIVFYSPQDGVRMVKRVVALPGETISITAGFWAIAPEANTQFKVERGSGLRYIGVDDYAGAQPVKPSPFTVTGGGQWVSTFAFTIPPALPPGTYEVEVMMDSPNFPEPVSATQRITVAAAS